MASDFRRYLRAKRSVDDRSIDRRLLETLGDGLTERATDRDGPLRVLELGAGIGTMVGRLLSWERLPPGETEYTAVDIDPDNVEAVPDYLGAWATDRPFEATERADGVDLVGPDRTVSVTAHAAEAATFVAEADREWDLLVGMAFLDIVDREHLPTYLSVLAPGGYWYFPVTFDGGTRFGPDHAGDEAVERAYHGHMDAKPGGDSNAGRHALERLHATQGVSVAGVAGSDWTVYPRDGGYPDDEAYFLRYILDTMEGALADLDGGPDLDDATLEDWFHTRRRQLAAAELVYLTHQLDLLGRVTSPLE